MLWSWENVLMTLIIQLLLVICDTIIRAVVILSCDVSPERPLSPPYRGDDRWRWWHRPSGRLSGSSRPLTGTLRHRWNNNLTDRKFSSQTGIIIWITADCFILTDQDTVWNRCRRISGGLRRCCEPSRATAGWDTELHWLSYQTDLHPDNHTTAHTTYSYNTGQ